MKRIFTRPQSQGLSSPLAQYAKLQDQGENNSNVSVLSIPERPPTASDKRVFSMKKRTIKSAIGSMRRNNKTTYTSLGVNNQQQSRYRDNSEKSGIFEIEITNKLVGNQGLQKSRSHRKNSSMDPSNE